MSAQTTMIDVVGVSKTFTLHHQDSATIQVLENVSLSVVAGECIALTGSSGSGKSTLMRLLYGNYRAQEGTIGVDGTDLCRASAQEIIALRRHSLGYVSQFLRVVPRVPTVDVVAEPLRLLGVSADEARERAIAILARLNVPEKLWALSPSTFSGGEQQRVNIARGLVHHYPVMLLDEPTASLDVVNRQVVLELVEEAKSRGAAIVGIFHDEAARQQVCDREVDVAQFSQRAVA